MIRVKDIYKRSHLNSQGADLSRMVSQRLLNFADICQIDFDGISSASSVFFQDFMFSLIIEFGSQIIIQRVGLINLNQTLLCNYQEALLKTNDYLDRISSRYASTFGDISEISCELLIKARELSRRDPTAAHIIFGLEQVMIQCIANMDLDQIRRVASSGVICFEPRFTPEFASKLSTLEVSEIDALLTTIGHIDMEGIYDSEYS